MRKIFCWLCIVSILVLSMVTGTVVSFAATDSTATVTDVYATGNWVVGQTVTAHYTYYDPADHPQVGDASVQWYRNKTNNGAENAIPGATSATYTITEEDLGHKIYFTVTVVNSEGAGKTFYSPLYQEPKATNSSATSPEKAQLHIVLMDGATEYVPGVTLRAVPQTRFLNLKKQGDVTYTWRVRDDRTTGTNTYRASTETYTIQDSDYGKWLECVANVKDENGVAAGNTYALIKVGTKYNLDAEVISANGLYRNFKNIDITNRLWQQPNDTLYTYSMNGNDGNAAYIVVDAKKSVKFDGFCFGADKVKTNFEFSYSNDNSTWSAFSPAVVSNDGSVDLDVSTDTVYTARYFKISFYTTGNCTVKYAFPYLSAKNRGAEYVDIKSVADGAKADNSLLKITDITYGMPLDALASGVEAVKDESIVSVTDASGNAVADTAGIKLTSSNIENYRIKVTNGANSQSYTLDFADDVFTNDFSEMIENKKYMNISGQTRDVPNMITYWYKPSEGASTDNVSYGIRETLSDGTYALKIVSNGATPKDEKIVTVWQTVKDLEPTGCYSFRFRVKPDMNTTLKVVAKAGSTNSSWLSGSPFYWINGKGFSTFNGSKDVRQGDFERNQWYDVEWVIDYTNSKQSLWVDGVNYADGVLLKINDTNIDKTKYSLCFEFLDTAGNSTAENYISDIACTKVWDVATNLSVKGDGIGMKLYDGSAVADSLTMGTTYTAKADSNIFADNYYVAVYKADYADDTSMTETGRTLIGAYCVPGSGKAQIEGIEIPTSAYAQYDSGNVKSKAIVKIFSINTGLSPARASAQID